MPAYIISFDIVDGNSEDYNDVHLLIQGLFPTNCRILTSTYLTQTQSNIDGSNIRDQIRDSISKTVHVIVAEMNTWSWSLSQQNSDCVEATISG